MPETSTGKELLTQEIADLEKRMSVLMDERRSFFVMLMAEHSKRYDLRFESAEKAVSQALTAAKEAVAKAETASEKRFDSVNEFRNTLKDQQSTLMPRIEADNRFKAVEEKIDALKGSSAAGANWLWGLIISFVVGVAIVVGTIVHLNR